MGKFLSAAVFAAVMLVSATANATILSSALTFNGQLDRLESTGGVAKMVGANNFKVGDVIYGFSTFQTVTRDVLTGSSSSLNIGPNHVAGLFAAQITSIPAGGAGTFGVYGLGAVTTPGLRLVDLLDASLKPLLSGIENSASFLFVSGNGSASTPINTAGSADLSFFKSASYSFELAGGLAPNGFFEYFGSSVGGQQLAGVNVLKHALGSSTAFVGIPATGYSGVSGKYDLTIPLAFVGPAIPPASTNGWEFSVQSQADINVVPEPTSILAFAGLAGLALLRRRSRA